MTKIAPIAVIGATGTVGSRIVRRLTETGTPVRAASRSGPIAFDWFDDKTFGPLVQGAAAVYLLPPVESVDPAPPMKRLVEVALEAGVPRLVLHSATVVERGAPGVGEIHDLIATTAPQWAVVRPSWFMQNLEPGHYLGDGISADGVIRTSVGDGRITFVDAEDIAAVAVRALSDPRPHQTDHRVTGPGALDYDDVAATLSAVTGRHIVHERVDTRTVEQLMLAARMSPEFVPLLAGLENDLRGNSESTVSDAVHRVTGRAPRSLRDYAIANASAWSR